METSHERLTRDLAELVAALREAVATIDYLAPESFDDPEHEAEWMTRQQRRKDLLKCHDYR
jgi:hypothetical protein